MKKYIPLVLGVFLLISEITLQKIPEIGFIVYTAFAATCIFFLSEIKSLGNHGKLIILFMIFPILRTAELFINLGFVWKTYLVYVILIFLTIFYAVEFNIKFGFRKKHLYFLPIALAIGGALGYFGSTLINTNKHLSLIGVLLIIALSEEILFRDMIQGLITKEYNFIISIIFTSIIYAILSLSLGIYFAILMFVMSLISCLSYHYTKNIVLSMAINIGLHFFLLVPLLLI